MVINENRYRLQKSWPWWRWVLMGLNMLALVLSIILSLHYLVGGTMIGCSGGSPCDKVLGSRWSNIAGILPVSGLAVGVYLAMLVASLFVGPAIEPPIRRIAWSAMLLLVGSIIGSAVWFTFVQKWIIDYFCLYCMTTHFIGLLLGALIIWRGIKEFKDHSNYIPLNNHAVVPKASSAALRHINGSLYVMRLASIGLVFTGIMAAFQVGFTPPISYRFGESQDNLPAIDHHTVPIVGSPDAPYIIPLLFDYQCPHCQQLHLMLDEAIRRFNGKVAFALCPVPLNTRCNPYIPRDLDEFKNSCILAKIGLAVWVARQNAFHAFDNWMFAFDSGDSWHPRSLEAARAKAIELVGQAKFDTAFADPWIKKYMQNCIRMYGQTMQNGIGGIPKLIFGSRWVIPEPLNANDLVMILQKSLGVPKP